MAGYDDDIGGTPMAAVPAPLVWQFVARFS